MNSRAYKLGHLIFRHILKKMVCKECYHTKLNDGKHHPLLINRYGTFIHPWNAVHSYNFVDWISKTTTRFNNPWFALASRKSRTKHKLTWFNKAMSRGTSGNHDILTFHERIGDFGRQITTWPPAANCEDSFTNFANNKTIGSRQGLTHRGTVLVIIKITKFAVALRFL